jgi:hypothetical protein
MVVLRPKRETRRMMVPFNKGESGDERIVKLAGATGAAARAAARWCVRQAWPVS